MKKNSFVGLEGTMLTAVIREKTARAAISSMIKAREMGATGFDLHVNCLEPQYRDEKHLSEIMKKAKKPVLALFYNNTIEFGKAEFTREEMLDGLVTAVKAGAAAVDLQGFMFDENTHDSLVGADEKEYPFVTANPNEVTLDPVAIEKQKEYVEKIHELGAEVVLSVHTGCYLNGEQVVSLMKKLSERGVDLIKLVTTGCDTEKDVAEAARTTVRLKEELNCKFQYHCNGEKGDLTRVINPMLGSYLIFCVADFNEWASDVQLSLKPMVDLYRYLDLL